MTKYYQQFRGEIEVKEISKEKAIRYLKHTYRKAEEILETTTKESPVRTNNAFYWKEVK